MLKVNLADIPTKCGVYLFTGDNDRIIYVGKAKSLRSRLASYFNSSVKNIKTEKMLSVAKGLKTIVTTNEVEAFLLECNLIKTEMPKYNILLKDSKGYPYVKLTNEEYPRLIYTRKTDDPNGTYFGPFVNAGELKEVLEYLKEVFLLRSCTNQQFNKGKICLKYQIKKCFGPCEHLISKEDYYEIVEEVKRFFKGDTEFIKQSLKVKMAEASDNMQYESAAFYRDRLKALDALFVRQQAIDLKDTRNIDLFYRYESSNTVNITQLFVRGGRLIGAANHFFSPDEDNLLERFIVQFYNNVRQFPDIVVAEGGVVEETLADGLSEIAGRKVIIRKRGYADLIELARKNALHAVDEYTLKSAASKDVAIRLAKLAGSEINHVECIDISHLGGENTVGVSIAYQDGIFEKKHYRKYRIKSAENNDVQSITEVMERKMINIQDGSETAPDLYLIDGGVSQLNAAVRVLKNYDCGSACLSISEGASRRLHFESPVSVEEVHVPGRKNAVTFKKNDPLLLYLQKIRDEAHRFAITYSRSLSLKKVNVSTLLNIEGIGAKRAKHILTAFPDIFVRENLSAVELAKGSKIPLNIAEKVVEFINSNRES